MKKIIFAVISAVLSVSAYAGAGANVAAINQARNAPFSQANLIKNSSTDSNKQNIGETSPYMLITPDMATVVYRTREFTYSDNMDILICPRNALKTHNKCRYYHNDENAWRTMRQMVPRGKTFIGFKSYVLNDYEYIEIYMK